MRIRRMAGLLVAGLLVAGGLAAGLVTGMTGIAQDAAQIMELG